MTRRREKKWSRRRVVHVAAAACGLPFLGRPFEANSADGVDAFTWSGAALGASAKITLFHPERGEARRVLRICREEIRRLETIFSLYWDRSELVMLNREGVIRNPSLDLRILLDRSQWLGRLTGGAFDITVQPLWQVYADHFRRVGTAADGPVERALEAVHRRVDYRQLDVGARTIGFLRPGMAATLNGIAQGAITDRVAAILKNEGFEQTLVNLGEIAALAPPPNRSGWRIGIDDSTRSGTTLMQVTISDRAVATSAGAATRFDAAGRHHHLFDPATGRSVLHHRSVSVISRSAMMSDALSTALAVLPLASASPLLRQAGADQAIFVSPSGSIRSIRGT